jgi:putative membrane protein
MEHLRHGAREATQRTPMTTSAARARRHRETGSEARRPSRVPAACLAVFLVVWVALGVAPSDRAAWLLENIATVVALPFAVRAWRRGAIDDVAWVEVTLFAILHTVGSHYTYSEVPLGDWVRDLLDLSRNHYDRLVHFLFGVLMVRPIRQLFAGEARGWRPNYVALATVALISVLYEVTEWLVASVADPAAGTAYLGTQGDDWDAVKDMALACSGALLSATADVVWLGRTRGRRGR